MTAHSCQRYINIRDTTNTEEFCNTAFCIPKDKQILVEFADFILTKTDLIFARFVRVWGVCSDAHGLGRST